MLQTAYRSSQHRLVGAHEAKKRLSTRRACYNNNKYTVKIGTREQADYSDEANKVYKTSSNIEALRFVPDPNVDCRLEENFVLGTNEWNSYPYNTVYIVTSVINGKRISTSGVAVGNRLLTHSLHHGDFPTTISLKRTPDSLTTIQVAGSRSFSAEEKANTEALNFCLLEPRPGGGATNGFLTRRDMTARRLWPTMSVIKYGPNVREKTICITDANVRLIEQGSRSSVWQTQLAGERGRIYPDEDVSLLLGAPVFGPTVEGESVSPSTFELIGMVTDETYDDQGCVVEVTIFDEPGLGSIIGQLASRF